MNLSRLKKHLGGCFSHLVGTLKNILNTNNYTIAAENFLKRADVKIINRICDSFKLFFNSKEHSLLKQFKKTMARRLNIAKFFILNHENFR